MVAGSLTKAFTASGEKSPWSTKSKTALGLASKAATQRFDRRLSMEDEDHGLEIRVERSGSNITIHPVQQLSLKEVLRKEGIAAFLRGLLETTVFDYFLSMVVAANSIAIGLEQKFRLEGNQQEVFKSLEIAFLLFYTVELSLHFFAWGLRCLSSNWVRFDCVLVLMGITSSVLDALYGSSGDGNPISSLLVLRIARLLRLARLVRAVRLVSRLRELWMLSRGLLNSIGTAFHTLVFGVILLYVVGCAATELIPLAWQEVPGPHDAAVDTLLQQNFRDLGTILLTLVQFITFDNAVVIYKPLIDADPSLALFFIPVLLLMGVVYMNLVTAIIVNSGLEQSIQDKEMREAAMKAKSKRLIAELEEAFIQADTNESGTISRKELSSISLEGKAFLQGVLGVGDLVEIFDCLDVEGHGEICIKDFCHGIDGIVVSETEPTIKRMERLLECLYQQMKASRAMQDRLVQSMEKVASVLEIPSSRPTPEGTGAEEAVTGEADAAEPAESGPAFRKPGDRQMPAWTDELIAEMKQVCTTDIRRAMDEACTSFLAQIADGAASVPSPPRGFEACRTSSTTGWEALPEQPEPSAPSGRRREPPLSAVGLEEDRCDDQSAQLPPAASATPPYGGGVPESRRAELLLPHSAKAELSGMSTWSRTQAL